MTVNTDAGGRFDIMVEADIKRIVDYWEASFQLELSKDALEALVSSILVRHLEFIAEEELSRLRKAEP